MHPPAHCKPIRLKWLYKFKRNAQGEIIRHKARLIINEYSQRQGIDYDEVFAPVVRFESIRVLVALAVERS